MKLEMIQEAKEILKPILNSTPLIDAVTLHDKLWIKAENLQKTGAFKLRGAYFKLSKLTPEEKMSGVVAASAGNHAQGVAYACRDMGIKGTIVMPATAPLSKIEATRSYGVNVELVGDTFNDAYEYAKELVAKTGSVFIEPFDDEIVMAGQGTIGLEIIEKMPDVEVVLVPIGGGGLAGGIAYAIKSLKPSCKVYGVQAKHAPSMKVSIEEKKITECEVNTMADGIAVKKPGTKTYDICKEYLDGIVLVNDKEISATILMLLEKLKLVAEGAGATAAAAALFNKVDIEGKKTVALLSGGNIDVNYLAQIIDLGLIKTGRRCTVSFRLADKPGNLKRVIDTLSESGANIITVEHDRLSNEVLKHRCSVTIVMETLNQAHKESLVQKLIADGYEVEVRKGELIATDLDE
ncbi:MAG: threonine ammonia-lyase [Anaerorhabdus sp.]|uniref:threonine ammonia-lyase n=1 Tax=Anaerorhabdus sp. TaxID=1872524 RepID=UPI003A8ABE2A